MLADIWLCLSKYRNWVHFNNNGIIYLGAGLSKEKAQSPLFIEKAGQRIGFLNYVTADTNPGIPDEADVYVNWYKREKVIKDIRSIRNSVDSIILLVHCRGTALHFHAQAHTRCRVGCVLDFATERFGLAQYLRDVREVSRPCVCGTIW